MSNIPEFISAHVAEYVGIRRDIHAHPELGYQEQRTADRVAQLLTQWGITVERGLGKTGVLGILQCGSSSRSIGLRADMDALPMQEENTFAHASKHPGTMHACGHDGHTAMLLGAAHYLSEHRGFDGTVYFIFQPAEEAGAGARAMIEDGLFKRFPMDAVFGLHNRPGVPEGSFGIMPSHAVMAASSTFRVRIHGRGAHAARPHLSVDPVPVACHMVLGFQSIVSRNIDALQSGVVSVTMLHTGQAHNVIPEMGELCGTVRTFSAPMMDLIEQRMRNIAMHTAAAHDCECEFEFERGYPATINHPLHENFARDVMQSIVGAEHVHALASSMGSEDFAFMLQEVPGAYVFIGNGGGQHRDTGHGLGPCEMHNPSYDFNDRIIALGATYWSRLAQEWLQHGAAYIARHSTAR